MEISFGPDYCEEVAWRASPAPRLTIVWHVLNAAIAVHLQLTQVPSTDLDDLCSDPAGQARC
jgi:hypothetical protein